MLARFLSSFRNGSPARTSSTRKPTFNNGVGYLPLVNIQFDAAGREVLAQVTSGNSGRKLAIVWGNKIIGVYIIDRPILDGILPVHTWKRWR